MEPRKTIDILVPVHNEAATIERTIREALEVVSLHVSARVIACEDGSSDGTARVLRELARSLPVRVLSAEHRKGYGPALLDGMRALEADFLLTMDGDGQVDPGDFPKLWAAREGADLVVGRRTPRRDPLVRRAMSCGFYLPYRALFGVPLRDPSSAFMLARRAVIQRLLPTRALMVEGFWWEYRARAWVRGCRIAEVPVSHRVREVGASRVYGARKLPGIGMRHAVALARLHAELGHRAPELA